MNIQAGSSKMLYHMVRDEPVKALHEVPFQYEVEAHLLRRNRGTQCFKLFQASKLHVPTEAFCGSAKIWITHQENDFSFFR